MLSDLNIKRFNFVPYASRKKKNSWLHKMKGKNVGNVRTGWGGVGVDVFTRIVCINPLVEQSIGDGPLHKKKGDEI